LRRGKGKNRTPPLLLPEYKKKGGDWRSREFPARDDEKKLRLHGRRKGFIGEKEKGKKKTRLWKGSRSLYSTQGGGGEGGGGFRKKKGKFGAGG